MIYLQMSTAALAAILAALGASQEVMLFLLLLGAVFFMQASRPHRLWIISAFILFYGNSSLHEKKQASFFTGNETNWVITFKDNVIIDGDQLKGSIKETFTGEAFQLIYRIKSEQEKNRLKERLKPGLTCRLTAKAELPKTARNKGEFNYRFYLSTFQTFFILTPEAIPLEKCKMNHSFFYKPAKWRAVALNHIYTRFPVPLSSVGAALLFGDRSAESQETKEDYERLGIVHILSISGLHVTFLVGLLFFLLIRFGITREKAAILLICILPFYACLTGAAPPVVRACLMTGAVLAAASSRTQLKPSFALGAAFLILTFVNPYIVFQASFQLSFAITWALVLSSGLILKKATQPLNMSIAISVVSQIASLPILMVYFAELSIIAPFANLLFVPFYSFVMLPLLLLLFFLSFFMEIPVLLDLANRLLKVANQLAAIMADFPAAVLTTGQPNMKTIVLIAGVSVFSFLLWEHTSKLWYSLLLCSLFVMGAVTTERFSAQGEITFLDVGQGDSIFIKLPYNKGTYLIDTGGQLLFEKQKWMKQEKTFSVGKNIVVPFLKRKGVTRLDKLIITHADFDHAGAAAEVLAAIPAKEIVISPGSAEVPVMKEILQMGIPVREGFEGQSWAAGNAFFQFLLPGDREYTGNNDSLVLHARIGGKNWLFTGDLEKEGEQEFQSKYTADIDWLKIGHHGSRSSTSSAFIHALQPEYAVISAGVNNRYEHPHQEVLKTLEESGVHVYRTDKHGSISYIFKEDEGFVSLSIPPE